MPGSGFARLSHGTCSTAKPGRCRAFALRRRALTGRSRPAAPELGFVRRRYPSPANEALMNPILGEFLSPDTQKSILVLSVMAVAGLFFWLAGYILRLQDITWFGRLGAVLVALVGLFFLLAAFILGSCTTRVGT